MTPSINPEDWAWLRNRLERIEDLPAGQRSAALDLACSERPDLASALRYATEDPQSSLHLWSGLSSSAGFPDDAGQRHLAAGEMFAGRYRVRASIGAGGMGEVYEVEDMHMPDRGPIALKTIRRDLAGDPEIAARFEREVRHALAVSHPNVCRIYDVGRHGGDSGAVLFLTMEFLPGGTLAAWLKDAEGQSRAIPESSARPVIDQMVAGLAAIHAEHIVHRDFKPLNVMLAPADSGTRVVITDLGIARGIGEAGRNLSLTEPGAPPGTVAYMPPEIIAGADSVAYSSDVYSLGVTMIEMLTGSRSNAVDPAKALRGAGVGSRMAGVVVKCLERDPAKRYRDAGEVAAVLDGTVAVPRLPVRVAAIVLAVIAFVSGCYYWWENRPPSFPAEARNWYSRGVADMQSGAWYAATKKFEEATRLAPDFTMAHVRLAEAWLSLEGHNLADREMLRAAGKLTPEEEDYREGVRLTLDGKYQKAVDSFRAYARHASVAHAGQLELARASENARAPDARAMYAGLTPFYPLASLRMAIIDARGGHWDRANPEFDAAIAGFRKASNVEGETEAIYQRGFLSLQSVKLDDARTLLNQALERAQLTHDVFQEARAQIDLSGVALQSGNPEQAASLARMAVQNAADNRVEVLYSRTYRGLATVYRQSGDYAKAEPVLQDALRLAREDSDERLEAAALTLLSDTHAQMGDLPDAATEAERALADYERQNNPQLLVQAARAAANAFRDLGQFQKAEDMANRALKSAAEAKSVGLIAQAQEALGQIALARQRFDEAVVHLRLALEASRNAKLAIAIPNESLQLGSALAAMGQFDEADGLFAYVGKLTDARGDLVAALRMERAKMEIYRGKAAAAARLVSGIAADPSDPDQNVEVALILDAARRWPSAKSAQTLLKLDGSGVTFATRRWLHFAASRDLFRARDNDAAKAALGSPDDYAEMAELRWRALLLASGLVEGEASKALRAQAATGLAAANPARDRLDLGDELGELFGKNSKK